MSLNNTLTTTDVDPYRLPTSVIPSHYNLHLTPDLESETFTGNAQIDVEISETTSSILLNTKELNSNPHD